MFVLKIYAQIDSVEFFSLQNVSVIFNVQKVKIFYEKHTFSGFCRDFYRHSNSFNSAI